MIIARLSSPTPVAAPFLEALSQVRKHCPAFGAHTGCALQNCSAFSQCLVYCFAICRNGWGEPSGRAASCNICF